MPASLWISALQQWNQQKENANYTIPKKGTSGYKEVKQIMKQMQKEPVAEETKEPVAEETMEVEEE